MKRIALAVLMVWTAISFAQERFTRDYIIAKSGLFLRPSISTNAGKFLVLNASGECVPTTINFTAAGATYGTNLGTGYSVFAYKADSVMRFKTLAGSEYVSLDSNSLTVTLALTNLVPKKNTQNTFTLPQSVRTSSLSAAFSATSLSTSGITYGVYAQSDNAAGMGAALYARASASAIGIYGTSYSGLGLMAQSITGSPFEAWYNNSKRFEVASIFINSYAPTNVLSNSSSTALLVKQSGSGLAFDVSSADVLGSFFNVSNVGVVSMPLASLVYGDPARSGVLGYDSLGSVTHKNVGDFLAAGSNVTISTNYSTGISTISSSGGGGGGAPLGTGFYHATMGEMDATARSVNLSTSDVSSILGVSNGGTGSLTPLVNNRVMVSTGGFIKEGSVTATELGNLSGSSSNIQTQLNGKQPLDDDLTSISGLASLGFLSRTASGTYASRTILAGDAEVVVMAGNGVIGNPTLFIGPSIARRSDFADSGMVVTGSVGQYTFMSSAIALTGGTISDSGGINTVTSDASIVQRIRQTGAGGIAEYYSGGTKVFQIDADSYVGTAGQTKYRGNGSELTGINADSVRAAFVADSLRGKYIPPIDTTGKSGDSVLVVADAVGPGYHLEPRASASAYLSRIETIGGVGIDSLLINTTSKYQMGYSSGWVVDTIVVSMAGGSSPSVDFTVSFGLDISAAGTTVRTASDVVDNTVVTKIYSSFDNATIPSGNQVWLTFQSTPSVPNKFLILLQGHRQ
jgi:hypothetical protein